MAIGKASDFKIYEEEFYGGMFEAVAQTTQAFNGASAGAMRLVARELKGLYEKESFLADISGLISRRDTTSVSSATDLAMTQGEFISVKVNRKIGPVAQTLDAWRKIGADQREMSFKLGQAIGERQAADYVNTAILAAETALAGQTNLVHTIGSSGTMTHGALVSGMAKMGDASSSIVAWVMHSKPFHDLIGQSITDKIFGVANVAIYSGTVATLGKPTIVVDAPALYDANGSLTDTYNTLGLVAGGVTVTESEQREIVSEVVTGLENLVMRVQGEYAFNVGVKGFKWDVTNGGANPTDSAIGTTTNWDKAATSDKHLAGVRIVSG
jgi:hypothetical protein